MKSPYLFFAILSLTINEATAAECCPPAKLGNIKDPDKQAAKIAEHNARWTEETAQTSPTLASINEIQWAIGDEDIRTGTFEEFYAAVEHLDAGLVGIHPTTDARFVASQCIKELKVVPPAFRLGNRQEINPLRELDPVLFENIPTNKLLEVAGIPGELTIVASVREVFNRLT